MSNDSIQVRLSSFDRFVNLQQTYKLHEIAKINQRILEQQYRQNIQLSELNKQVSVANEMTKKILSNQIDEIKKKETQVHLKKVAFSVSEIIEIIEGVNNMNVKQYIYNGYVIKLTDTLEFLIDKLEEINDKSYCRELGARVTRLNTELLENSENYRKSEFYVVEGELKNYGKIKDEIREVESFNFSTITNDVKKPNLFLFGILIFFFTIFLLCLLVILLDSKNTNLTLEDLGGVGFLTLILGFFVFRQSRLLKKWRHRKNEINKFITLKRGENRAKAHELNNELKNHELHKIFEKVNSTYPEFSNLTELLLKKDLIK